MGLISKLLHGGIRFIHRKDHADAIAEMALDMPADIQLNTICRVGWHFAHPTDSV